MNDPRSPESERPPYEAPSFVAPSNPGFAPMPPASAGAPGYPPASSSAQGWPSAGTVPFTPHRRAASGTAVAGLVLSILGTLVGLVIGWGFPLSIVGLVLALRSRRAPGPSRTLSSWSIALAVVSALASVGWLAYSVVVLLT